MIAVGAGVGEYVELQCRELAVLVGAGLHGDTHRVPRRGRDELFLAGQFEFHGPSGLERSQRKNVLDEHFLLAAEPAADALTEHPNLVGWEMEQVGQRAPRQERHLRAGADVKDSVGIDPGDAAMGFQRRVLDALGRESTFIGDSGLRQRARDIAKFAVGFRHDIAARVRDAVCRRLVAVNRRGAGRDGGSRIDHCRQDFILNLEPPAAFFGGSFGFGDHRRDLLPDEADDIVEYFRVVGIHPVPLVPRGREQPVRCVFKRQHCVHAGDVKRGALVDRNDLRVRMRRTQHLDVQHTFQRDIERIARRAAHDLRSGGGREAAAECGAGGRVFDVVLAVECVFDRAVAGATADVALQRGAEVLPLRLVQRRAGQDHARCAEAALKPLRIQKRLLHRMGAAIGRKAFDRRHGVTVGAERRDQAAMHRLAVDQHGAGAAVAGVAALLDAEMAEFAQERAQALAGLRLIEKLFAVDLERHAYAVPCNSLRISSASRSVMCLRHIGLP